MIVKYAVPMDIFDFLKVFFEDKKKAVFQTIAFLSFMDIAIFPREFFNIGVVLNCWSLVYLRAVQHRFLFAL